MSEEQSQERTEKPTPFKLKEARDRGQVSKSTELNSLFALSSVLFLSYLVGEQIVNSQLLLSKKLLTYDFHTIGSTSGALLLFEQIKDGLINIYWPLIFLIIFISIVSNLVQTGPILSFFPLKPDTQRLNPIKGFKKIFSKRMIYEFIKTTIKLILFATVAYITIDELLIVLLNLIDIQPESYPLKLVTFAQSLGIKMLLVVLLAALVDFAYTRWEFIQQMQMSHKDIKDEVKKREGDPLIRSKRRELQKEAVEKSKSLSNVPDADVLITNPTHLAIALKFNQQEMTSPHVTAKGSGELAQQMKILARKHKVAIVENKPLARSMYNRTRINSAISEEWYQPIAKIYAWLASNRNENKQSGSN
ncbi:Flagellar biosynthesis protein FlhB [gamma proteobacterium IMCC1989]|nr:Flagellar biosynthesis protein FlhB [gamma proteobacterium IMCC1989]